MTTDTKLIRFLNERIGYCKIQDNRTSRTLYEDILHRALKGEFEEGEPIEDYPETIAIAEEFGFCRDCLDYYLPAIGERCLKCLDSNNKCNFKPKEDK
jgi:hypothetical protein